MSRRKTNPEDIRNPEHYFNRYIALEVQHDLNSITAYYNQNSSLEEMLVGNGEYTRREKLMTIAINERDELFEQHICDSSFFGWIDMIENPILLAAIRTLSHEDQVLLTYRFNRCFTQIQTAEAMHIPQTKVSYQERRIKKLIKDFFEKVARES